MKSRRNDLFWGIALIVVGGFFLALNSGWIPELTELMWPIVFALISVVFFVAYFLGGNRNWGLLFPAVGTGAVAITIWLANAEVEGTTIGGLFMLLISIPFWVGFLADRRANWGLLIPGWIVAVIGVIILLAGEGEGELIGALVMFSIALPFFVVYSLNRKHWWALIPGWTTGVIGVIILLANNAAGEIIGALVLFSIGLPFLVVYLANRQNRWALIPGWVLSVLALVVLVASESAGELIGALVMFAIALPFFVVYFANRDNWWALIPAGVMASVGLTAGLAGVDMSEALQVRLLGSVLFIGIGITFAVLWSLRSRHDTDWAKYPAIGLGVAALLVIAFGAHVEVVWSVLLIGSGLWLLLRRSSESGEKGFKIQD